MTNELKISKAVTDIQSIVKRICLQPNKHASIWFSGNEVNVLVTEGFRTSYPIRTIDLENEQHRIPGLISDLESHLIGSVTVSLSGLSSAQGSATPQFTAAEGM